MTVMQAASNWVTLRKGSTTAGRSYERPQASPVPIRTVTIIVDSDEPSDEQLVRNYVTGLWAEDWDSPEDSIYDKW